MFARKTIAAIEKNYAHAIEDPSRSTDDLCKLVSYLGWMRGYIDALPFYKKIFIP